MPNPLVDLHIHSQHSDGSYTPAEIVRRAKEAGVGLLAIADHDVLEGSLALAKLCGEAGIRCIHCVETNTMQDGVNYHVLGYGVNLDDPYFQAYVQQNRHCLDSLSDRLILQMEQDFRALSYEEYLDFPGDPAMGGWKGLHYLLHKGVTASLHDGIPYYGTYGCGYDTAGFPDVAGAVSAIHAAGGKAVLAHPGESISHGDLAALIDGTMALLDTGIDGLECYHPKHPVDTAAALAALCQERHLLMTGGSDCHGSFGGAPIGHGRITEAQLNLQGISIQNA